MQILGIDAESWANAISNRIDDECSSLEDFSGDSIVLREALALAFKNSPPTMLTLIGTGIIEEDYFDPLN